MNTVAKIAYRTIGAAGIGVALYDSVHNGRSRSKRFSDYTEGKHAEKAYFDTRMNDTSNFTSNAMQDQAFELRMSNPVPKTFGTVKGFASGMIKSLSSHLILVTSSAFALLSKGTMAKVGTIGVGVSLVYDFIKNGFGLGKSKLMK